MLKVNFWLNFVKRKYKLVRQKDATKVKIGVDAETYKQIFAYIGSDNRHKEKFKDIVAVVLEKLANRHLYRGEKISPATKDITAMRFFVGQENDRIYCKEMFEGEWKIVVMGILHLHKTADGNSSVEINLIETLATYEYEFEG